ncbi:MAG TPA: TfoX/Sxy family protein [Gaiellaceae bacterium]|nr:TfoX/Sxy family protein [Gaiellaceae bacterium]
MAYDEALAAKLRALVPDATEKAMFGGLAFIVGGNMVVAAGGRGGLLVRVDPEQSDELVRTTAAEPMVMRGRAMRGWLRVPPPARDAELAEWVERGVGYARTLPPK